jgi:hypothetical protein
MVDEVALGQVSPEYFDFSYQFSFHQMLHTHLSSGAGTIGPTPRNKKKVSQARHQHEADSKKSSLAAYLHGTVSQKMQHFITTAVRTSDGLNTFADHFRSHVTFCHPSQSRNWIPIRSITFIIWRVQFLGTKVDCSHGKKLRNIKVANDDVLFHWWTLPDLPISRKVF